MLLCVLPGMETKQGPQVIGGNIHLFGYTFYSGNAIFYKASVFKISGKDLFKFMKQFMT